MLAMHVLGLQTIQPYDEDENAVCDPNKPFQAWGPLSIKGTKPIDESEAMQTIEQFS